MTNTQQQLYALKGMVTSELTGSEQTTLNSIKDQLSVLVNNGGDLGVLAVAILSLEIAVREEANA